MISAVVKVAEDESVTMAGLDSHYQYYSDLLINFIVIVIVGDLVAITTITYAILLIFNSIPSTPFPFFYFFFLHEELFASTHQP